MAESISSESKLTLYASVSELSSDTQELIEQAKEAASRAYAPYSDFEVGAALRLSDGTVVTGNNQENACYPAGLCAERVAFFAAKSVNPDADVREVAIVAKRRADDYYNGAAPCGSCRQVMSEYENNQKSPIKLFILAEGDKVYESASIENLLPFKFSGDSLFK